MGDFTKFLLVSGIAAAINFFARVILEHWFTFSVAVALAFPIALISAYIMNRKIVFKASVSASESFNQFCRFALVNLLALVQVWGISVALAHWLLPLVGWTWRSDDLAHVVGILSPALTSYFAHKHFTFAEK